MPRFGEARELAIGYVALWLSLAFTAHVLPGPAQEYAYSIILAAMVYGPIWRADVRRLPLSRYGLTWDRAGRALAWGIAAMAVFFPLFTLGNDIVQQTFLHRRFDFAWPEAGLASLVFEQSLLVALPEEIFYRGYMQTLLSERWPARVRLLGAEFGASVWLTSLLFALGHLAAIPAPFRLLVFFPSLLFGWLRAKTGSLLPGILVHASANILQAFLIASYHG